MATMPRSFIARALGLVLTLAAAVIPHTATAQAPARGYLEPLTPENSLLLLVDLQPQFAFSVASIDTQTLVNNATGIAKAARVFKIPTILATISAQSFGGPFFPQVQAALPDVRPFDRTMMNAWEDNRIVEAIKKSGRKKIIIGGLWTDSCVTLPALSALGAGYEVYVLTDVAGDVNAGAHNFAIQRMIQAGATPVTWLAVLLEWQRDWARAETRDAVLQIGRDHGGGWGIGIFYAGAMGIGAK
jgi:nicotinamidase-related amidase